MELQRCRGRNREEYGSEIAAKLPGGWTQEKTVEEAWGKLKGTVLQGMEKSIGRETVQKRREWISEETMGMMEHRQALGAAGMMKEAR